MGWQLAAGFLETIQNGARSTSSHPLVRRMSIAELTECVNKKKTINYYLVYTQNKRAMFMILLFLFGNYNFNIFCYYLLQ